MNQKPRLQLAFTFPYRWLADPEDRKYLSENLSKQIRKAGIREVYATSNTDRYAADFGSGFVGAYYARLKTLGYQPVKVKLTAKQLEAALKPAFPMGQCLNLELFFVQTNTTGLPIMELELYY